MPMVPALIGSVFLLLFMPESPRALLTKNKDEASARIGKTQRIFANKNPKTLNNLFF